MGWSLGFDSNWKRDIGYGVPAKCDHPGCKEEIHRGLAFVCGGEPHGGDDGCGLYFCAAHLGYVERDGKWSRQLCERCAEGEDAFDAKPDIKKWIRHKLKHSSWGAWRDENPKEVADLKKQIGLST